MCGSEDGGHFSRLEQLNQKLQAAEPVRAVGRFLRDHLKPEGNKPYTGKFNLSTYENIWHELRKKVARKARGLPEDAEISFSRGRPSLSDGAQELPPSDREWVASLEPNEKPLDDEQFAKLLMTLRENQAITREFAACVSSLSVMAWAIYQMRCAAISHADLLKSSGEDGSSAVAEGPYRLLKFEILKHTEDECVVWVKLGLPGKREGDSYGKGKGPVGAFVDAVKRIIRRSDIELEDYEAKGEGPGADASGTVSFTLRVGKETYRLKGYSRSLTWKAGDLVLEGLNLEYATMRSNKESARQS